MFSKDFKKKIVFLDPQVKETFDHSTEWFQCYPEQAINALTYSQGKVIGDKYLPYDERTLYYQHIEHLKRFVAFVGKKNMSYRCLVVNAKL